MIKMNHKVTNVTELHEAAIALYNNAVVADADSILDNLNSGIESLKNNWKGKDAGVQIQSTIEVYNAMVAIRNALAEFAVESSKVAANYREIQNSNGAGLDALNVLSFDAKTTLSSYDDVQDTIDINQEAAQGRTSIQNARDAISGFMSDAETCYDNIRNIWTAGPGLDSADSAFTEFKNSASSYQQVLTDVSDNISTALTNYLI